MSMLRYYMTPETRQAVIDESNRLIATRATTHASRARRELDDVALPRHERARAPDDDCDEPSSVESVFARLVADLQSAAARTRSQ